MGVAVLAGGIDEAGYGPKLGPMTMAAFTVSLGDDDLGPLHRMFEERSASGGAAFPVRVEDSKRLFSPRRGILGLEESALALVAAANGRLPENIRELVAAIAPADLEDITALPWYREGLDTPLPLAADAGRLGALALAVGDAGARHGVGFHEVGLRVFTERRLNGIWDRIANKQAAPLLALETLLRPFTERGNVVMAVDQQSGRHNYAGLLQRVRPGGMFQRQVSGDCVEYANQKAAVRLLFLPAAEEKHPTVAAASMIAKYTREVLMRCFYVYWRSHGLEAPDGYGGRWRDFVEQARPHLYCSGLDECDLLRSH